MRLGLHQSVRLEQRLSQSPQMIQAMQILQLPTLDLQERIEQELVENPFLEVTSESEAGSEEDAPASEPPPAQEVEQDRGLDEMIDVLERYERDFGEAGVRMQGGEEGDKKYEAMQNAPELPETLQQALIKQVSLLELHDRERRLIEYLIWSLDDRGYLAQGLEELLTELVEEFADPELTLEELENALARLRQVTHPAMGARDVRDCLLLQLPHHGLDTPLMRKLIESHLDDLGTNRLPHIAKTLEVSIDAIKEAVAEMRVLDPLPGAEYGESRASIITPDVVVEEQEGEYVVRLDRQRVPELTLSTAYRKLLQQARKGDGVREWVKKRVESAQWFIEAIHQRQSTMERIAEAVFRHQRGFLEQGISGLVALRMQEIADEIGLHISTVSRGVSGKYAQTPRGIFPLKFFFTGGTAREGGTVASQISIKERIRELVAQEDGANPLSDDQIAALLEEKDGLKLARRTVSKYRKALGILASTQRRAY